MVFKRVMTQIIETSLKITKFFSLCFKKIYLFLFVPGEHNIIELLLEDSKPYLWTLIIGYWAETCFARSYVEVHCVLYHSTK